MNTYKLGILWNFWYEETVFSIAQHNLEDNEVYLFYINLMIHNFTHMLLINPALNCTKIAISVQIRQTVEREK